MIAPRKDVCARCGAGWYASEDGRFVTVAVDGRDLITIELCKHCGARPGIECWALSYASAHVVPERKT